ncbi:MAG: aminotransferase class I/II-fold pyridoxal phosphate-dependent enzyme [Thermosynechococcaceae cyanobacterium]
MPQEPIDQAQTPLLSALQSAGDRNHNAFYTPGHKRGRGTPKALLQTWGCSVFQRDLPELPELDDLFAPEGVILEAQALAAEAFGADQTWFLTNGSSCGVMTAILAVCAPDDRIIVPRNCHRSVISGLTLSGAMPIFIEPELGPEFALGLAPHRIAEALDKYPQAKAVMVTSPTYEGVCVDLDAISTLTHAHNIPLLVDEAHGPHFAFHSGLPPSALSAGADLAVQSTHKVLGALTQAAMLHTQGDRISPQRICQALQWLQSTSPSYLLLASLDAARQQMALQGTQILEHLISSVRATRQQLQQIKGLSLLSPQRPTAGFANLDITRLTVGVSKVGLNGLQVDQRLHEHFAVTAELPTPSHLTFVPSLGTTQTDLNQLVQALRQIALEAQEQPRQATTTPTWHREAIIVPQLSPRAASFAAQETIAWEQATDRISAELICPYPPGIPVLYPGGKITAADLDYLRQIQAVGGHITGCTDPDLNTLRVLQL